MHAENPQPFRYIPLSYNHADSHASALRLILTLNPHWEGRDNKIEFVRFTDGITNTVCFLPHFFAGVRCKRQAPPIYRANLAPAS